MWTGDEVREANAMNAETSRVGDRSLRHCIDASFEQNVSPMRVLSKKDLLAAETPPLVGVICAPPRTLAISRPIRKYPSQKDALGQMGYGHGESLYYC